jgi:RNA polymerase sigma-70 factor (family 1)
LFLIPDSVLNVVTVPQTYDEGDLLKGLQEGRSNAFLELYTKYHPALYHYVLRFVKVPAIAEDILQEVFLTIWRIRKTVDPDLSFRAYLYRISRNIVFKLMKKAASDENLRLKLMRQLQQNVTDSDVKLLWHEYEETFYDAVAQLPLQRQKVFRLCREEGKTYEQVAAELGISRNTVKEHMVKAMKSIKEYFHQHCDISLSCIIFLESLTT